MNKPLILVIEDEHKIAQLLHDVLVHDGFRVEVLHQGGTAVERIRILAPDLVILDLMLPGQDGMSICTEVRRFSTVPVLMLTAKVDEIDRLMGLQIGADDYVCKSFSPREVVARVRAILRRVSASGALGGALGGAPRPGEQTARLGRLRLSLDEYLCQIDDQAVDRTPVELRLLAALIGQPGRVFSRERLMELSYNDGRIVSDRTMDTHVKNLRRKLNDAGDWDFQIRAIYGVGYKVEPLNSAARGAPAPSH
jgi:two-component system response regulator BaeR